VAYLNKMISITNLNESPAYQKFIFFYEKALNSKQNSIDAISISSFSTIKNEVESRYVNLKYIDNNKWTFFTNYNSLKADNFKTHNQISSLIYWNSINVQIRIKATIEKSDESFSDLHFSKRGISKNALSISSKQSEKINSYEEIVENYNNALNDENILSSRPSYWGGYTFIPYYFEFWQGHDSRLNKREIFSLKNGKWEQYIIQP